MIDAINTPASRKPEKLISSSNSLNNLYISGIDIT